MTRIAMLVGSFMATFALLVVVWMVSFGNRPATADADPTPSHSPYYTLAATPPPPTPTLAPTPMPTPSPSPTPTPVATVASVAPIETPQPSPTPVPLRTLPASIDPIPAGSPGETSTFVVAGTAFVSSDIPDGGQLVPSGDGVILETTGDARDALWVTYRLDPEQLPAGAAISSVDVRICGQGQGQFYEVYGPVGGTPVEYEQTPPQEDGCWHFDDAPADDLSVIASTMMDSQLYIERVEYTVTFAQ